MSGYEDKAICFISFISRHEKPLYIQSFDLFPEKDDKHATNNFLKYNFLSHMALDIITSPSSVSIREQQQDGDIRNGAVLLLVQDNVTVYGYESNTGLKIIIGFNNQAHIKKDETQLMPLRELVLSIHKVYVKTICNPFKDLATDLDEEQILQTPKFDKSIKDIVDRWNDV